MSELTRIQNQDTWKRTQIRIPQDDYDAVVHYAQENNVSLNTAMLELISKGLKSPQGTDVSGELLVLNEQTIKRIAHELAEHLKQK